MRSWVRTPRGGTLGLEKNAGQLSTAGHELVYMHVKVGVCLEKCACESCAQSLQNGARGTRSGFPCQAS